TARREAALPLRTQMASSSLMEKDALRTAPAPAVPSGKRPRGSRGRAPVPLRPGQGTRRRGDLRATPPDDDGNVAAGAHDGAWTAGAPTAGDAPAARGTFPPLRLRTHRLVAAGRGGRVRRLRRGSRRIRDRALHLRRDRLRDARRGGSLEGDNTG